MLSRLSISNYALIKALDMQPDAGLNIITGETGAGKSIMLGAVGLLLGNRADTKVLYDASKKCIIEGEFNVAGLALTQLFEDYDLDYDDETVIRREITPNGKSRAFVNDTPVTLDVLKELGGRLMDVHSQNQTLLLGATHYQLKVIDAYAQTTAEFSTYQDAYQHYRQAAQKLDELERNAERLSQESDYNDFLLQELAEANLQEDEQAALEEELKMLEHAEEIKGNLNHILAILDQGEINSTGLLHEAKSLISQVSDYASSLSTISQRLEEAYIEIADLVREIENQEQLVDVDPARTEAVRERLSMIYHLQNKHHVPDIKGLLEIQKTLERETFLASNLEEEIAAARKELATAEEKMRKAGITLSKKRQAAFTQFTKEIVALLQQLGMPDAQLHINREEKEPAEDGLDSINFSFSANKGVAPAPLSKVASGGEYSRLMFCFKYVLADKAALPTMVFDEIDAGISGEVALQMGQMMQVMANNHQVITISHLPQIAGKGQAHYFVYKETEDGRSVSRIKKLTADERVLEIAKMIGGDQPSENAFESARELISATP